MEGKRFKKPDQPEAKLQAEWRIFLEARGWFVKDTHGGMFQSGFPDMFITHVQHGPRWVEVKLPQMRGSRFTAAQERDFPKFLQNGTPIWILTTVCPQEYRQLFTLPQGNLLYYLSLKG